MWQMTSIIYHSFSFSFFLLLTSSDSDVHCGWDPVCHGRLVSQSSGQSCDSTAATSNERGKRRDERKWEKKKLLQWTVWASIFNLHTRKIPHHPPQHTHTHQITSHVRYLIMAVVSYAGHDDNLDEKFLLISSLTVQINFDLHVSGYDDYILTITTPLVPTAIHLPFQHSHFRLWIMSPHCCVYVEDVNVPNDNKHEHFPH